jgi:putative ABC transport system permease protein
MSIARLILREIRYRQLNFALGVLGAAVAIGVLVAELVLLKKHDLRTEQILAAKDAETRAMMAKLEDDVRKITVNMGFNVLILPQGQSLNDLYDEEKPARFMPEEYAAKLARSRVATINHVLPTLTQKVKWPERQRKVVVMGVKGEVLIHSGNQKPILEAVAPGQMVVGSELHQSMNLATGQVVKFMGQDFIVSKLLPERGNADDVTLWINLQAAQTLLGRPGLINAILALECNCAADRLAQIRAEISALLPDTRVIEFASQAIARAEARNRAAAQTAASLEQEREHRQQLRQQRESFAAVLVPLVLLAAGVWIALLTLTNVRDRRAEIGILRAIGLQTRHVLAIFLGKAVLMGLAGAMLGLAVGLGVGLYAQEKVDAPMLKALLSVQLLGSVFLASPLLTVLASWIPTVLAARQDPAVVLQKD